MTLIRVAHSPDSDDAFMFYGLAKDLIDTGDLRFEHVLSDIETLNREAFDGTYEVTAVSIHAYAHLDDRYALLASGASMGDGYGPVLVSREVVSSDDLAEMTVAIPGRLTSAALALKMWNPRLQTVPLSFDEIMPAVRSGEVDAGVVIHEGQLTWKDEGFHRIVDLGVWWAGETDGLPLPLGGNLIRRDLGGEMCKRVAVLLKSSIEYALEHREEALDYALDYGRGLDRDKADRFVGMYVNELTVDYGERGRRAVSSFLERAFEERLIPKVPQLDFL
ncbi:MAG: ABC transporter substrate-binding protein [Acidobacteria bacterium]|jgi:1,4-dihydroxy-6-naphthoate synthase|nr:ABC transporter substrate-binding protein [Acidobacteriota bacterium]